MIRSRKRLERIGERVKGIDRERVRNHGGADSKTERRRGEKNRF
jgi:hypothetical protein